MKYYLIFLFLGLLSFSCADGLEDASKSPNTFSADFDSLEWASTNTYTQRSVNEGGPLMIVGKGAGYTMELVLGGITDEGEYDLGSNRIGRIMQGNYTYTTLDVQNAGKIIISNYSENRIIGSFYFNAQWLSANNEIQVSNGKFDVSFY